MVMKRRTFLAAGAATLGTSKTVGADSSTESALLDSGAAGLPDLYSPCGRRSGFAVGQVDVSGVDRVNSYYLSTTGDVRADLIDIFEDALSQLPAHIEFGPGDFRITRNGLTIELPKGGRGLSISGNGTRFRLAGPTRFEGFWHCLRLVTKSFGVDPANGEVLPEADYFSDLSIYGIAFYDDNPAAHSQIGMEETHGINLQWIRNARITNCSVDNVGDEGIELDYCENVVVANNCLTNTTQWELGGGGAISIKNGCKNVSVLANTIRDGGGFSTYGIAIKAVNPIAVSNITIAGNSISNMITSGININIAGNGNNTGTELVNSVSITGNVINGGLYGVGFSGGGVNDHTGRAITIANNVFSGQTTGGVKVFSNKYSGISICNNCFDDISGVAINANGSGFVISNNEMTNVKDACILLFSGAGASITGGIYRSCGVNASALFEEAIGFSDASISGAHVLDCRAPIVIKNIRHISGCVMESDSDGLVLAEKMIDIAIVDKGAASITNNSLRQGCIRVAAAESIVSGNSIVHSRDPGADAVRITSGASNCLVSGNHVTAFSNRYGINIAGDGALVTGNHVAGSNNPIVNTGSGNSFVANKGNEANETDSARMNPGG